ncbi:MAG TPA: thioesterase family protein [Vicinamibacteria bacterium]|nr:thioesterase family protein [Vicinamibacteria bacterium]
MSDEVTELFDAVRALFVEKIPFNKLLGTEIEELSFESARIRFGFRDELVGNYIRGSLHGGVVSATLDLTGGLVAFMGALRDADGRTPEEKMASLANVGTIDLRVDYLRPGLGAHFLCSGRVLRTGNKVAVIRMELVNDKESLIAVGTGAYLVG